MFCTFIGDLQQVTNIFDITTDYKVTELFCIIDEFYKHFFIKGTMKSYFPKVVSYNRFVELESHVFFLLMFFLNLGAFGRCTGITFVDSTMIPVCHNLRRYANKVFKGINDMLKNTAQIVHSRHRSVNNFVMNLISALGAYCFFDNKPKALQGYCIENTKQLSLF